MARYALIGAAIAAASVNALQIPLGLSEQLPWFSSSSGAGVGEAADKAHKLSLINTDKLQDTIHSKNLLKRAEDLFEIAKLGEDEFGHPTRVIGSEGHIGTLAYITSELAKLGSFYTVSNQTLPAVSGDVYNYRLVLGDQVPNSTTTMGLTPPTLDHEPVFGDLALVDNNGCDPTDYPAAVKGSIALISRGDCPFGTKSELAGRAGAVAAVVYNTDPEPLHGTLGTPSPHHVATFGIGSKDGERFVKRLQNGEYLDGIAYMDAEVRTIHTQNILAQTTDGDQDNCVVLGGHSDSVTEGPGINDDGSGSLSLLEIATQLVKFRVNNCVRFAWWAAEEEGLLGSDYYVKSLSEEENQKIRLFMDYDMMGSPNYAYQIYDANNEDNPKGSLELKQLYIDWYEKQGLNYTFIPFDGRSDYDGFIRNGIPGGGIATGAEGIKTKEEAIQFGGQAGEWYDPCYHQLCDDVSNVNLTAWEVNTKLIAHSVATYALSFEGFPQRTKDFGVASYDTKVKYHGSKLVL